MRKQGPGRILILSASAGAGHLRAAEALAGGCAQIAPDAEVRHVDALSLTPAPFRRLYGRGYLDLVNHAPDVVGWLYDRTDRPPRHRTADRLRLAIERLNAKALVRAIRDFAPDVVAHTHFLPAAVVARERRRRRLQAPHAVVVTDFDVHRFWYCPGVERYCVARHEGRVHLASLGAAPETIRVTGIPIDLRFAVRPRRAELRRRHDLAPDRPVLLILCGGFGVGPVEELVRRVAGALSGVQVVVIAGRNEALRDRLARWASAAAKGVRVVGFTSEMHEWMALSDLAVTKPGGLTTSEALACGLPLVVAHAIPGQETRNATMLYEAGAAISGENPHTIAYRVAALLDSPPRLAAMRRAAHRLARPRAALDVAAELLELAAAGTSR